MVLVVGGRIAVIIVVEIVVVQIIVVIFILFYYYFVVINFQATRVVWKAKPSNPERSLFWRELVPALPTSVDRQGATQLSIRVR